MKSLRSRCALPAFILTGSFAASLPRSRYALPAFILAGSLAAPLPPARAEGNDIADVVDAAGNFKTLLAALKAAGPVEAIQGAGPFTLFAPTDEAFAKLPTGMLDDLMKPANRAKLTALLTYHYVSGKIPVSDLKTALIPTVHGPAIFIKVTSAGTQVNNANMTKADIPASNGVIHVIDTVLTPE
jgi:uncharacterized surface protein with fasciclin (FAS1) repeats